MKFLWHPYEVWSWLHMNRIHTLRSVADEMRRDKRTAQAWYQRAKKEHGELGEIIDSTRYFNDSEQDILISYAGSDRAAGATAPQITVESGNHQFGSGCPADVHPSAPKISPESPVFFSIPSYASI